MLINDAPSKFLIPFADVGGKNSIPLDTPVLPQNATLSTGFPPVTRTPVLAGGIAPAGLDFNGIFYLSTAVARWQNAGAGYVYDAAFANDVNVLGYPAGAKVLFSDFKGYWLNSVDSNVTDPEAGGAGWSPGESVGGSSVAMTSSNVTLTALEAAKNIITITGVLTTNLQLIFPAYVKQWLVVNNATGAFTVTCKTLAGSGVAIPTNESQGVYGTGVDIKTASTLDLYSGYTDFVILTTSGALDASMAGKGIAVQSALAVVLDVPLASTMNVGDSIVVFNHGTGGVTFNAQGADTLSVNGSVLLTSYVTQSGEMLEITKSFAGKFTLSGSATLKDQVQFDQSLTATGSKTLPGDPENMLMKWGQVTGNLGLNQNITFATAFPNACLSIVGIAGTSLAGVETFELVSLSASVAVVHVSGTGVGRWFAIGH